MGRKQTGNGIVPPTLNARLRWQREVRGWSLERVAEELDRLGGRTDSKQVGKWERGQVRPSPCYQEKLCQLYTANAEELGFCPPRVWQVATMRAQEEHTPNAFGEKRQCDRSRGKQWREQQHLQREQETIQAALSLFGNPCLQMSASSVWIVGFLAGYVCSLRVSQQPQMAKEA